MKFSAHQWAEDHIIYEESSTEINEGTLERLAHLLERAYAAGWSEACSRSAEAAWEAETHHDAVDAINKIAEERS